jgi:hypothetical protein
MDAAAAALKAARRARENEAKKARRACMFDLFSILVSFWKCVFDTFITAQKQKSSPKKPPANSATHRMQHMRAKNRYHECRKQRAQELQELKECAEQEGTVAGPSHIQFPTTPGGEGKFTILYVSV